MAIVVDVTFATDHPQIEKKEIGEAKIGGGPVFARGSIISPVVFNLLRNDCREEEDSVSRFMRPDGIRAPMPMRFTSRAKVSRPASSRFRTDTCIRRTRWCRWRISTNRDVARRDVPSCSHEEDGFHSPLDAMAHTDTTTQLDRSGNRRRQRAPRHAHIAGQTSASQIADSSAIRSDIAYLASDSARGQAHRHAGQ